MLLSHIQSLAPLWVASQAEPCCVFRDPKHTNFVEVRLERQLDCTAAIGCAAARTSLNVAGTAHTGC